MSFFSELGKLAVIEPIASTVAQGRMVVEIEEGGKPFVKQIPAFDPESPWIHSCQGKERICNLWLGVYFMNYGLVPRKCHACWKCVTTLKSLKEAFEIKELQENMGIHAKVGLEIRPYSPGLWHAFWYAPLNGGLDVARNVYRKVQSKVKGVLGIQQKVILKRGCTEMEIRRGPSDRWVYTERDMEQEVLLDELFEIESRNIGQHPVVQAHVMRKWIHEAWSRKDPTVWEYADPSDFVAGPVTYHESKHRDEDFPYGKIEKAEGEEDGSGESRILRLSEN